MEDVPKHSNFDHICQAQLYKKTPRGVFLLFEGGYSSSSALNSSSRSASISPAASSM